MKSEKELEDIKAEICAIDTNYYKSVNGIDMRECAEDFKNEVINILDKHCGKKHTDE